MESQKELERIFTQSGITLTPTQAGLFWRYYQLIREYNDSHDLTRLTRFEDMVVKHFVDSVYTRKLVSLPSPLLDIGTGAGLPGIPLKIMEPGLELVLAEPRNKRVEFLEIAITELGLSGVTVYPHLVTGKSFFNVNGVITRALESAAQTLERVAHFLPVGGTVLFMKGPAEEPSAAGTGAYELAAEHEYRLPGTSHQRRLLVYRKTGESFRKEYHIMHNPAETTGHAIASAENKKLKEMKKIAGSEGLRKGGRVFVSGKKLVMDAYDNPRMGTHELVIHDGYVERDPAFEAIIARHTAAGSLYILKKNLFNEIDVYDAGQPLLAVSPPAPAEWDGTAAAGCTLLIPFQDPTNVGAVIRSALGLGVSRMVVLREAANPYHPKSIRASAGTVFRADLMRGPSIHELSGTGRDGVPVVALDSAGADITGYRFPGTFLLLPGIEGPGLPEELRENAIAIPLAAGVESLNAATAVSIALYEWRRVTGPASSS